MPNPHHRMSHRSRNPRLPVSASGRAAASKLRREPHSQRAAWAVQERQKGGAEDAVLGNGLSWNLPADTGAAGAAMISWSHPTPLCLMPSMLACVLPIPAPCPDNMQSHAPRHPTPCPPCMHVLPLARMPSAHALPSPTPAQPLFPGHKVLTCFPGCLGPTSGGCSPAASHRQTWHSGRHSAESPESSSVNPKQKVIGLPWE